MKICQYLFTSFIFCLSSNAFGQMHLGMLYGNSDSCESSEALGLIEWGTSCLSLVDSIVGSIKVDGVCKNIPNTSRSNACFEVFSHYSNVSVIYGQSESCDITKPLATVKRDTQCSNLSSGNSSWSFKTSGVCHRIPGATLKDACVASHTTFSRFGAVYGNSRTCEATAAIDSVSYFTDCGSFSRESVAGSIKSNGTCIETFETSQRAACLEVKGHPSLLTGIIYENSDTCEVKEGTVAVNIQTDCNELSGATQIGSFKVNGICYDVAEKNMMTACFAIQKEL